MSDNNVCVERYNVEEILGSRSAASIISNERQ